MSQLDDLQTALTQARAQAEACGLTLSTHSAQGELLLLLFCGDRLLLTWMAKKRLVQRADASRPLPCPTWAAALALARKEMKQPALCRTEGQSAKQA